MPGQLKQSACCPMCGHPLLALLDTTNTQGVRREFYHDKTRVRCVKFYSDFVNAQQERRALEVERAA